MFAHGYSRAPLVFFNTTRAMRSCCGRACAFEDRGAKWRPLRWSAAAKIVSGQKAMSRNFRSDYCSA